MKIGLVPDLHLKEKLGYSEYVADGRVAEKAAILGFIKVNLSTCDKIVFMGDQFNSKNNSSPIIREFLGLLESFEGKEIFVLAGNHEKIADRTAIDFLREVKKKKWHVITDKVEVFGDLVFAPYFHRNEFGTTDKEVATKKLLKELKPGKILFSHQSVAEARVRGISSSIFDEIVLPTKEMEKKYDLAVFGHIHASQRIGKKILLVGSTFNNEVGEHDKSIWKIDEETLKVEEIKLPGRGIYRIEGPIFSALPKDSIIKVILTKRCSKSAMEKLRETLSKYDGYIILEQIPSQKKTSMVGGNVNVLDLSVDKLLEIYAKQKNINLDKLKAGFELITKI